MSSPEQQIDQNGLEGKDPDDRKMDDVFPSLQDEDLERLGVPVNGSIMGNNNDINDSKESNNNISSGLSDKEIESKFTALSLAFKTDRMTLKQRLQRQRRQRDLAENNMASELARLLDVHKRLTRAASDAERGDFLDRFRFQLDALDHASRQVSSAAEMYGAVQQEDRLSHAMEVIDLYVESLKRLHQKLCQELDEKKRVLSENNIVMHELQDMTDEPAPRTTRYRSMSSIATNPSSGAKRRASIAAPPRSQTSLPEMPLTRGSTATFGVRSLSEKDTRPRRRISLDQQSQRKVSLMSENQQISAHLHQLHQLHQGSERGESRTEPSMSEIAELSESRRESAADADPTAEELSEEGDGSVISDHALDKEDYYLEKINHPLLTEPLARAHSNGICHAQKEKQIDRVALGYRYWLEVGHQVATELWYTISKDSFRWLRFCIVCGLLVAAVAVLLAPLLQASPPNPKR